MTDLQTSLNGSKCPENNRHSARCPALTLLFVQKYSCLYNKKKITRWLEDMNFIFSW